IPRVSHHDVDLLLPPGTVGIRFMQDRDLDRVILHADLDGITEVPGIPEVEGETGVINPGRDVRLYGEGELHPVPGTDCGRGVIGTGQDGDVCIIHRCPPYCDAFQPVIDDLYHDDPCITLKEDTRVEVNARDRDLGCTLPGLLGACKGDEGGEGDQSEQDQ